MKNSKERFTEKVADYVRFRPDYPEDVIDILAHYADKKSQVADVGSGTGIFSKQLLESGYCVYGVEPNDNMRQAAEDALSDDVSFTSLNGSAESTGLDAASVNMITAAQSFHWFNNIATKEEFRRILTHDGVVAIIWNKRDLRSLFHREYDQLLKRYAVDYLKVTHLSITDQEVEAFFDHFEKKHVCPHRQMMNFEQLVGRLRSSSYCPPQGSGEYQILVDQLEKLFNSHREGDHLYFEYQTCVYVGRMAVESPL
ncbi:class I SAM-dependent methyltransferase [Veronia pacifica]|uniref:Methyltransferase type 11 domain-containing protein n=1 Tax=Veronia pacifica TaxID=1080227 RepID=A0A1C3EPJ2_9GAMM|nr:class I SAM-dependent methyltransferase [Veronia pacifica]ODA35143.1 hypothetical protein A8L45_05585 [Veronia pacifica]